MYPAGISWYRFITGAITKVSECNSDQFKNIVVVFVQFFLRISKILHPKENKSYALLWNQSTIPHMSTNVILKARSKRNRRSPFQQGRYQVSLEVSDKNYRYDYVTYYIGGDIICFPIVLRPQNLTFLSNKGVVP